MCSILRPDLSSLTGTRTLATVVQVLNPNSWPRRDERLEAGSSLLWRKSSSKEMGICKADRAFIKSKVLVVKKHGQAQREPHAFGVIYKGAVFRVPSGQSSCFV